VLEPLERNNQHGIRAVANLNSRHSLFVIRQGTLSTYRDCIDSIFPQANVCADNLEACDKVWKLQDGVL